MHSRQRQRLNRARWRLRLRKISSLALPPLQPGAPAPIGVPLGRRLKTGGRISGATWTEGATTSRRCNVVRMITTHTVSSSTATASPVTASMATLVAIAPLHDHKTTTPPELTITLIPTLIRNTLILLLTTSKLTALIRNSITVTTLQLKVMATIRSRTMRKLQATEATTHTSHPISALPLRTMDSQHLRHRTRDTIHRPPRTIGPSTLHTITISQQAAIPLHIQGHTIIPLRRSTTIRQHLQQRGHTLRHTQGTITITIQVTHHLYMASTRRRSHIPTRPYMLLWAMARHHCSRRAACRTRGAAHQK